MLLSKVLSSVEASKWGPSTVNQQLPSSLHKVPKSVELYSCLDTFSMTLDSEGTGASAATKLIAVSEIQLDISLFSPESTSSVMVGTVELGFLTLLASRHPLSSLSDPPSRFKALLLTRGGVEGFYMCT